MFVSRLRKKQKKRLKTRYSGKMPYGSFGDVQEGEAFDVFE